MPAVSWLDLDTLYRDVIAGRTTLIGWGASGSFRVMLTDLPFRPAYLIDSNPALWGTSLFGVPIHPPERLRQEDPEQVVVMIYSAYFYGAEIARQIDALGPYRHTPPFVPSIAFPQLQRLRAVLERDPPVSRPANPTLGIVVQGAVEPMTETVLRYHRTRHPEAAVILSSWTTSDPALLERLTPWCDRLVLSEPPPVGGQGNRNFQIRSTAAGLEAARAMGLRKVLKTRGDMVVMAPDVLAQAARLQERYPPPPGAPNRLVVSSRYTYKHIPYNVSDLVLFGDLDDLRRCYAAPLDERPFAIHSPEYRRRSFRGYSQDRAIPEVYLATHYLTELGRPPTWDLADSWAALRDHYIVVDEEWFDLFWPKYGILPVTRITDDRSPRQVVDHYFWQRLHGSANLAEDLAEDLAFDIDRATLDDLYHSLLAERDLG